MKSVRQSMRPKHQVLILKCYPRYQKGVQDVRPNSSELSYLLYYASARRTKLQKVGAFLERKTAKDVSRGRLGDVQVTLQILTALIEKLPRELPLYVRSLLTVIETVLRSNDISMVEETIPTFETFCLHQDLTVPGAEKEYSVQYQGIVKTYAKFASPQPMEHFKTPLSRPLALRWRNAGLKAVQSVLQSETLSADGGRQLSIIVPVILQNLYTGDKDMLVTLHLRNTSAGKNDVPVRRRRMSSITVQTVDSVDPNVADASGSAADSDKAAELEVRLLALKCLERIFSVGSNRVQIRLATGMVLQFIVSKPRVLVAPEDPVSEADQILAWAPSLMELIAKWCPVQDRFITVFTAAETLLRTPADDGRLEQHIILASVIDSLLKSSVNMIGLSVIDVLHGFLNHILRVLQFATADQTKSLTRSKTTPDENTKDEETAADPAVVQEIHESAPAAVEADPPTSSSAARKRLITLLQQCVEDLTVHIYYADQVSDMVRAILRRIKPLPGIESNSSEAAAGNSSEANGRNGQDDHQVHLFFQTVPARVVALEAIKGLLVVANLRTARAGAGVEARNKVGIHVWDGTQWLMRDIDIQIRYAYADAFLSWLQLETGKQDFLLADTSMKLSRSRSKREPNDKTDKSLTRALSVSTSADKAASIVRSNFLQLFHLVLYENALDAPTQDSNILLIHLLLTNLVEHLGINAARFGIPMIIRLQQDLEGNPALQSPSAQIHIGSLIYGYFAALSEKFDFETSKVGSEIQSEISRQKKAGTWFEKIRLPAVGLSQIPLTSEGDSSEDSVQPKDEKVSFIPFTATAELVRRIEEAYASSLMSTSQSPPSSPRPFSMQVTGYMQAVTSAGKPSADVSLPSDVREQMLAPWSREACLASLEKESAKTASLSGSRTGHSVRRVRSHLNDGASPAPPLDATNITHRHEQMVFALDGAGYLQSFRKGSGADDSPRTTSSRDSTLRVNDLKRMLSVSQDPSARRASPLRGRQDATSDSRATSSSESMMSGAFSGSDVDAELQSGTGPQSGKGNHDIADAEGRPANGKASVPKSTEGKAEGHSTSHAREKSNDIPPVPPLPPGLNIPGDFPNDSSSSNRVSPALSPASDRPVTAPGPHRLSSVKSKKEGTTSRTQHIRSLSGRRSRSSTNLASNSAGAAAARSSSDEDDGRDVNGFDIDKLLEGILPDVGSGKNGPMPAGRSSTYMSDRRSISNKTAPTSTFGDLPHLQKVSDHRRGLGLGRPPY